MSRMQAASRACKCGGNFQPLTVSLARVDGRNSVIFDREHGWLIVFGLFALGLDDLTEFGCRLLFQFAYLFGQRRVKLEFFDDLLGVARTDGATTAHKVSGVAAAYFGHCRVTGPFID